MKSLLFTMLIAGLGLSQASFAKSDVASVNEKPEIYSLGVPVDRIWVPRINGFKAVGPKQVVVYTSPSKSYLITLRSRANGLRFSQAIGVTSTGRSIYAKFDSVVVDGFRYPIESIAAIDKATAKSLSWKKRKKV
ncbi:MAG: DUF6491 family protein [Pseudomonadota bacterium]